MSPSIALAAPATDAAAPLGRVFVVDDDPAVLQALERLFRAAGLLVQTFRSAAAFFEASRP